MSDRQQLEQAILAQEQLRGTVPDAVIDATIGALRKQLAELDATKARKDERRKQVTVLFADLAGWTHMAEQMDPEDVATVQQAYFNAVTPAIREHGGVIEKYIGDAILAVFGVPQAREDDPERAVRAALAMQAALKRSDVLTFKRSSVLRIGISTGLVVAALGEHPEDFIVTGDTVNLASRLEEAAPPGSVLIAHDTFRHVRGLFDVEVLDPLQIRGREGTAQVYLVQRARPRSLRTRFRGVEGVEIQMVGREAELKALQDAYFAVVEDGERQVVTAVGEAGLGKSRLLYEFENWLDLRRETVILFRGRARLETQRLAYGLWRDLFSFRFGIQDDEQAPVAQDKVVQGFRQALGDDGASEMKAEVAGHWLGYDFHESPHVAAIGDDAEQLHNRGLMYFIEYFKTTAAQSPVVLLLEDLHWSDDSSLDVLARLALGLDGQPTLIVGTARPRLYQRRPHWFEGRSFHGRINLHPLSKRDSRSLVEHVLRRLEEVPEALRELVVSNAEGNPFYVEELIKVLVEDGVIIPGSDGHGPWRVQPERLSEVHVPPTLTGVLQARLDSLPQAERTVLQQASVVGRVFWDKTIGHLSAVHQEPASLDARRVPSDDQTLEATLAALRAREMVYRRDLSAFADANEHVFKHAILREVTYESVLKKDRRAYHALVAEWLIEHSAGRVGELAGLIANHLVLAGDEQDALAYLRRAGDHSARIYANEESLAYYARALELVSQDLPTRFDLLISRVRVLGLLARLDEQYRDIQEMLSLSDTMGERNRQIDAMIALMDHYLLTEHRVQARTWELGTRALQAAREKGCVVREAQVSRRLGEMGVRYRRHIPEWQRGRQSLEHAIVLFRQNDLSAEAAICLNILGSYFSDAGDHARAQRSAEEALTLSRQAGDRRHEARSMRSLASAYLDQGLPDRALPLAEAALALSREIGDIAGEISTLRRLGLVYFALGRHDESLQLLQQSLALAESRGFEEIVRYAGLDVLNLRYRIQGKYQSGIAFLRERLETARQARARPDDRLALAVGEQDRFLILAFTYNQLEMLEYMGLYAQALSVARECCNIAEQLADPTELYLAWIVRLQAEIGQVADGLQSVASCLEPNGQNPSILFLAAYTAWLSSEPDDWEIGLDYAESAAEIQRAANDQGNLAFTLDLAARLYLATGRHEMALRSTQEVMSLLESNPEIYGHEQFYFTHSRALRAAGELQGADEALRHAYRWVMKIAAQTQDEALRNSWLENVRYNREIVQAVEQLLSMTSPTRVMQS